ncbi:MAG: hypothetical protein KGL39_05005 [Patescibacteria group bacterium]|nr:hypothetical protein [Patescibacteria group bacterium]
MAKPSRWLKTFESFAKDLRIKSKEIVSTDERGVPLEMWESQRRFLREVGSGLDAGIHTFNCLKSRQLGVCLDPNTRVLKADLTWEKIKDLRPGDEIVGVDERTPGGFGRARKMRTAVVEAAIRVHHPAYRISFDDGRSVICTKQHPWLTRYPTSTCVSWASIEPKKATFPNEPTRIKVGGQVRWVTKPWSSPSYEDGWFGGILDGEGSISNDSRTGVAIMAVQRPGEVWNRMVAYALDNGYSPNVESDESYRETKFGKVPVPKLVFTRMDEIFRLIGHTRPSRFVGKRFWEGRELPGKRSGIGWSTIVSIEPVGSQDLIDLQTTTGTYIAEGFVSHNTTISLALVDVFWPAMHPGIIGCLVTDTEKNREINRGMIESYIDSFPDGYFGERFKIVKSNRQMLQFSNGSRLDLLVAGTKKKAIAWGEGQGYSFAHLTELASYGDVQGLKSLEEGFAQGNPHRLFVYESTAKGMNHWRTKWMSGLRDITQRSFFIGWWSGDNNRVEKRDPRFVQFGLHKADPEEREMMERVQALYNWRITPEQLAWFRWKRTQAGAEQDLLEQNQPSTAEDAFVQSGYSFFQTRMVGEDIKNLDDRPQPFKGFRYEVNGDFYAFRLVPMDPEVDDIANVELKMWEQPVEGGRYAIGFDPAYGRNEHKDGSALAVFRCFADRMVQVAEYRSSAVEVKYAAWAAFHICAAYRDCMINTDMIGPGQVVMSEFDHLRQLIGAEMNVQHTADRGWQDAAAQARWFLYHRQDSFGSGFAANYKGTGEAKEYMLHKLRGAYVAREIDIRSKALLREMLNVVVDDSGSIGAPESSDEDKKDDRVFALALAHLCWTEWIRKEMIAEGKTYEAVMQAETGETPPKIERLNSLVQRFLAKADEEVVPEPSWREELGLE